jgi:hypothetical protein
LFLRKGTVSQRFWADKRVIVAASLLTGWRDAGRMPPHDNAGDPSGDP